MVATPKTGLDRPPPNWKALTASMAVMCKQMDATVSKLGPLSAADMTVNAQTYMQGRAKFPASELVSAKTPVEVTHIRGRNTAFCADWARVHNPGALPIDGGQEEWLRDQWFKEKVKKEKAKVALATMIPAAMVQAEKDALARISKENAAWLKGDAEAKEKAPLFSAATAKDKGRGEKDMDEDLLRKLLKNFSDPKESWYGIKHGALAGFVDTDPLMKGVFAMMKVATRDPNVAFLKKALKIPAAGTVAAETAELNAIRKRNETWLKSVGGELTKGGKVEKRADVLAMAKKGFPDFEKPTALATSGGNIKVTPTNSAAATSATAARVASVNTLWPPPAPALKKLQDTELARIHKDNLAFEKTQRDPVGYFVDAHEQVSPAGLYYDWPGRDTYCIGGY
jgi:hypothetical protein